MENVWIEWAGGKPPVHANTRLTVKLRDGRIFENYCVSWKPMWTHETDKAEMHIVAYFKTGKAPKKFKLA